MSDSARQKFIIPTDLAKLQFIEKLIDKAAAAEVPAFERLKYIRAFSDNLDAIFCASTNLKNESPRHDICFYREVSRLISKRDVVFCHMMKELYSKGFEHIRLRDFNDDFKNYVHNMFYGKMIKEVKTTCFASDDKMPYLVNGAHYAVIRTASPGDKRYVIANIPYHDEVVYIRSEGFKYLLMEDIILTYIGKIVAPLEVAEVVIISVVGNYGRSDINDIKLEISGTVSGEFESFFCNALDIEKPQIFVSGCGVGFGYLEEIERVLPSEMRDEICYPPLKIRNQDKMIDSVIGRARIGDMMSIYPYDSYGLIYKLLSEAAEDRLIGEISIILRHAGDNSNIVRLLKNAALRGKRVRALVELRSRGSEDTNIILASELEQAGCEVFYGPDGYEVFSNLCLISEGNSPACSYKSSDDKREYKDVKCIAAIGTGDLADRLAPSYTDLLLITNDANICKEASKIFNCIIGGMSYRYGYFKLLCSPFNLKKGLIRLIEYQMALKDKGRIFIKANAVTDKDIVDKLVDASYVGVRIRMLISGACNIIAGIKNYTDNIEISSYIGRFMDHYKVFVFGNGDEELIYISTADLTTEDLERRIHIACPIHEYDIRNMIKERLYEGFIGHGIDL